MMSEISRVTLGQELRRRRKAKGLGQKVIAQRAGISIAYLSQIELDQRYPTLRRLADVAQALDTRVSLIFRPAK